MGAAFAAGLGLAPDDRARDHGFGRRRRGLSARLAKIDTAIYRRKRIEFEYHTMETDQTGLRKVDPYHLLFEGGQFYLVGYSHERKDVRVFRLSRIRGKVAYATKAEHDFQRPEDFDPRGFANRIPWQLGDPVGVAEVEIPEDLVWYVERQYGDVRDLRGQRLPDAVPQSGGC